MQKKAEVEIHQENDFVLAGVQVSPSHNRLSLQDRVLNLQPKAMAVLVYLAKHHSRVISNHELIETLWAGRIVTHGSVQKSINSIRSAFTELIGEQELIAHYSKRGYQVKVEPDFKLDMTGAESVVNRVDTKTNNAQLNKPVVQSRLLFAGLVLFVLSSFLGYQFFKQNIPQVSKHHKLSFHTLQGYTNETGHERNGEPHPDNQHFAYVKEHFNLKQQGETKSELMIRNGAGKDWRVAETNGSWFKLAWSPGGSHLVALEVIKIDGMPTTPGFYEEPNYLYSFHIFSLNLNKNQLVEKQLLSQWQGRIFSVTWWDENHLEFVAKQGSNSATGRYRYSIVDQSLSLLDEIEGAANPIASAVYNKITALASVHKNQVQVDFLREDQSIIGRYSLDLPSLDISWIKDGSGVLIYSESNRSLGVLYMDGQKLEIPIADARDKVFSRPRYSYDGQSIFYTEEKRGSNIRLLNMEGVKTALTQNADLNYGASFSSDGQKIVYASVRNNQIHLWLVEAGNEQQLTSQPLSKKVGRIIWSETGDQLVFNSGSEIHRYSFANSQMELLLKEETKTEPVAYLSSANRLMVLKSNGDIKNLWQVDLASSHQKQITFGSVGSAISNNQGVFFQYTNEPGLWFFELATESLKLVTSKLPAHIKLLGANSAGLYYISGGICRESDVYHLDFAKGDISTALPRSESIVMTTDFHPAAGVLYTDCYLPEANIIQMK
jgi:DNA-binding winged helix-turn-helix (wHTH) protein/Tol biopolymer transport system component